MVSGILGITKCGIWEIKSGRCEFGGLGMSNIGDWGHKIWDMIGSHNMWDMGNWESQYVGFGRIGSHNMWDMGNWESQYVGYGRIGSHNMWDLGN